jgi:hypothetical protein
MTDNPTVPAKPATDTTNSAKTASRYAGVFSLGSVGIFMFLGTFPPDQQTAILKSANVMYESLRTFVGAAADIWFIVFPVVAIWLAKMGIDAGKVQNVMARVFALAKSGNLEAKVAIVNAASSKEIGTQAIINPELAPLAATSTNVVATPAAVPAALPQNPAPAA